MRKKWPELLGTQHTFTVLAAIAVMVLAVLLPSPSLSHGVGHYPPLHTTLEIFSVTVSFMVFAIGWNTQKFKISGNIIWLCSCFLAVALLDLMHLLSYDGMPTLITPSGAQKAIDFWLGARFVAAVGLIIMALSPWIRLPRTSNKLLPPMAIAFAGVYSWVVLFHPELFPATFSPDTGLTDFKITAEYVIIALYGIAALLFFSRASSADSQKLALFSVSMVMLLSEYFFTLYSQVTDVYNFLGHVYKIVAYWLLYKAIFVTRVREPFIKLTKSEKKLSATINALPDILYELDDNGTVINLYTRDKNILTADEKAIVGKNIDSLLPHKALIELHSAMAEARERSTSVGHEIELPAKGKTVVYDLSVSYNEQTLETGHYIVLARDITKSKLQQRSLAYEARLNEGLLNLSATALIQGEQALLRFAVEHARYLTGSEAAFIQVDNGDKGYQLVFPIEQNQTQLPGHYWQQARAGETQLANSLDDNNVADANRLLVLPFLEQNHYRLGVALINKPFDYDERDIETLKIWTEAVWQWLSRLRQERRLSLLSSTVAQSPSPIIITDEQANIEYVNQAFTQITGYSAQEVAGKNPNLLKSGRTPNEVYDQMWEQLTAGKTWQGELINKRKDGQEYIERAIIYPLRDEQGHIHKYIAHKEDITYVRESEKKVRQLTLYDSLTGLPNKEALRNEFDSLYKKASQQQKVLAMLLMDMDNFRLINEALGNRVGDLLIQEQARRLYKTVSQKGLLSRLSGDTFVLLIPEKDAIATAETAARMLALLRESVELEGHTLSTSCSIGISMCPSDASTFDALLTCAESAMYEVKSKGRNAYGFYSPSMQTQINRQLVIANELKYALEHNEFSLAYQPQCTTQDTKLVGAEALIRWNNRNLGVMSPGEFIPLAEQSGLILAIDNWVFKTATQQLSEWRKQGMTNISLAINLSAAQFSKPHLTQELLEIVNAAGVPPQSIELELTEEIAIQDPQMAEQVINELRGAGFKLALDDFGTGYSSMGYLKRFAFDKLKIDRAFITELSEDKANSTLVSAMIKMAKSFNMHSIAEGVENQQQLDVLKQLGCDLVQGYFYSRPLEAEAFVEFTKRNTRETSPL